MVVEEIWNWTLDPLVRPQHDSMMMHLFVKHVCFFYNFLGK